MEVIRAGVRIVLQIRQGRQWNISRQALRGASATMRQMGLLLHVTDLHLSADEGALLVEHGEVHLLRDHGYDW